MKCYSSSIAMLFGTICLYLVGALLALFTRQPTRDNLSAMPLRLLVDPVVLGELPALNVALLEPELNLLLGVLNAVAAVADVAADILTTSCQQSSLQRGGASARGRG